jgi:branched-chain amino acid transport system ATP-binding protein
LEEEGGLTLEVLKVTEVSKNFGGVSAVKNFSMVQRENEITAIIGPNGAGKTTVFNLITGVYTVDSGRVWFYGRETTRMFAHTITALGITRTFQNIRLFRNLNVLDNLKVAYGVKTRYTVWEEMARLPRVRQEEKEAADLARSYLAYFGMEKYAEYFPYHLPYGLQRRLELARALMASPKLLLLDEPGAGLNPKEIRELMGILLKIKEEKKLSMIIVEHHMELVMKICSTLHVLDFGKKIAEGRPEEIKKNEQVLQAYLGDEG